MKIKKCAALALLLTLLLCACGNDRKQDSYQEKTKVESTEEMEARAEEEAVSIFGSNLEKMKKGENIIRVKRLEDLASSYPDNTKIANYYYFSKGYLYLYFYENVNQNESEYEEYKVNMGRVEVPFEGEYSDFIDDYINQHEFEDRDLSDQQGSAEETSRTDTSSTFTHLSRNDKIDILVSVIRKEDSLGGNVSEKEEEKILSEVAAEYGITEFDIMVLELDGDLLREAYAKTASVSYAPSSGKSGGKAGYSLEEKNAIQSAKNYLSFMAFSRSGLIGQLEFEGYSNKTAVAAVDSLSVNWNEQAKKSAETYLSIMPLSRKELIAQLIYEGFSESQAQYAAKAVGY